MQGSSVSVSTEEEHDSRVMDTPVKVGFGNDVGTTIAVEINSDSDSTCDDQALLL